MSRKYFHKAGCFTAIDVDALQLSPSKNTALYMISSKSGASRRVEANKVADAMESLPKIICLAASACKRSEKVFLLLGSPCTVVLSYT